MAHKLKITLDYTNPKVYRTVIVPEHFSFHALHTVIQCIMNWEDCHLYQFQTGAYYASDSITLPNLEGDDFDDLFDSKYQKFDASKTYLSDFFNGQKKKMNYVYDFGDDWCHTITPLKKPSEEVLFPKCIDGANDTPIEDCGGIPGFYELLSVVYKKRKNAEDREMMEWYGILHDTNYTALYGFHIDRINLRLLEAFSN